MDRDHAGLAGLAPAPHDRFARWPRGAARLALGLLAAFVLLAAWAPGYSPPLPKALPTQRPVLQEPAAAVAAAGDADDHDLHLYRVINARVRSGDDYYRVAVEEQRRNNYPVTPGLTVRLPTLALLAAAVGDQGMMALRIALLTAMLLAFHRRFEDECDGAARRPMALALLVVGAASALGPRYGVLHEVWAAQLMALSFALHRPEHGRWGWAWLVAALALAVRELVLPYVLLLAVCAAWERRWREAAAWLALIALFTAGLVLHLHLAAEPVRPGDPASPSWLAVKGIAGLLYKINNSTFLGILPLWLSGPLAVLALFGWAGRDTPFGRRGFLLVSGYALAFMVVGRDNNFYWGLLITPLLFMGAAFLPASLPALWRAAGPGVPQTRPAHA